MVKLLECNLLWHNVLSSIIKCENINVLLTIDVKSLMNLTCQPDSFQVNGFVVSVVYYQISWVILQGPP